MVPVTLSDVYARLARVVAMRKVIEQEDARADIPSMCTKGAHHLRDRIGASTTGDPAPDTTMVALIGVGNSIFGFEADIHLVLRARARKSR